jgi:hypothetical protein
MIAAAGIKGRHHNLGRNCSTFLGRFFHIFLSTKPSFARIANAENRVVLNGKERVSLIAQGGHRIDCGRSARRDICRSQAHPAQGTRGKRKSHGIAGFYSEEHACNKACDAERDGQAHPDPEYGEHQGLTKD